jgi:hypothetical protein
MSWATIGLIAASAAVVTGLIVLERHHLDRERGRARANPAHEDFVGRRVECPAGPGTVERVDASMLIVRLHGRGTRKLVRIRKDRVTLV